MEILWFCIAAVSLTAYVVLDGFDFGAGLLHLSVARTDAERRQVLGAIGPFWDGNEVWLLVAGGVLFLAFPRVLASGLSGFYLAIMLVLWVLILRGVAIEFRSHVGDGMWRSFWDATFWLASTLAPILLGAALGNLVRGVPLDPNGWFSLALWDSFSPRGALGILDWYTTLSGILALVAVAHHGALFLAWRTDGAVRERSLARAAMAAPILIAIWIVASIATALVAPDLAAGVAARPLAWLAGGVAVAGMAVSVVARRRGRDLQAFLGSCAFLVGMLAATAAAMFPVMLKSAGDPALSLTAFNAASRASALGKALWWWPVGFVLAVSYFVLLFRLHRERVGPVTDHDAY